MKLTILTPERKLVDHLDVSSVTLPGSEGQIQILVGHAEMIGTLETGPFSYAALDGSSAKGVFTSGFFDVNQEQVIITAETCELAGEIDIVRARTAQKKAENALLDGQLEPQVFRKYQLKLQRALIRQQTASRQHGE